MIRTEKSHLNSVARSHAGMSGKNNEDRFGISAYQLNDTARTPVLFAILSDGIGGHRAGEVAAEMVVDLVSQIVAESDGENPTSTMQSAIVHASQEVYERSQQEVGRKGMGATVACAWIIGKKLYTAFVGDSRIYLIRDGTIQQLTRDHSWIQEAIESGIITPEQAVGHPNAHVIRRYVGSPKPPEVDFRLILNENEDSEQSIGNQGTTLKINDRLILCSDGLTDLVSDDEILQMLQEYPADMAVDRLIQLANQRGGHDNITIIAIRVPEGAFAEKREEPRKRAALPLRQFGIGCLSVLLVAALAAAGFFGWRWFTNRTDNIPTQGSPAQPGIIETTDLLTTRIPPPTEYPSPLPSLTATRRLLSPSATSSGPESNIPPPPNSSMSPIPTNTQTATLTPTNTATIQPSQTPTP
jgi:serine/threonine protein phosphatase PrpC